MLQWMLMPFRRYAEFSGRSGREEFWMFILFNHLLAMVYTAAFGIVFLLLFAVDLSETELVTACFVLFVPYMIYSFYVFLPALAVTVRRLHDIDKSGWNILWGVIPLVGAFFLLLWHATPGTRGPNRFGPDPLAGEAPAFA